MQSTDSLRLPLAALAEGSLRARPASACPADEPHGRGSGMRFRTAAWLFSLVGGADLLLTLWLLRQYPGKVYEANPLAAWLLGQCGWLGLVGLKLAAGLVAVGICLAVSRQRPELGRRLCLGACALTAVVVGYSGWLALTLAGVVGPDPVPEVRRLEEEGERLSDRRVAALEYHDVIRELVPELTAGQCTLDGATARLERTRQGSDPAWLKTLGSIYPAGAGRQRLALNLVRQAVGQAPAGSSEADEIAARLRREFRDLFGEENARLA